MFEVYLEWLYSVVSENKLKHDSGLLLNPFELELCFWGLVLVLTLLFWMVRPRWLTRLESLFVSFSRHRVASVVVVGLLALLLRASLLPWIPAPVPSIHDENSYVLQARTFVMGRITNPTPPLWEHFETFHVNMTPTYQSMYPVGQAAFLALGLKWAGQPWFGVWLSVGLMCAAVCWMLQAWMPPPWALLGGLICILRFDIFGSWINSYYGGAVAALGGALVLGALPRIRSGRRAAPMALVFALGLMLLANTRPYEGFVFSLVPCVALLFWLIRTRRSNPALAWKIVGSGLGVIVPVAAGMLYYNQKVTGHPFVLPYLLNQVTYHVSKPFLWQSRYPFHAYNHPMMRKFYLFHELPDYLKSRTWWGLQDITERKFGSYYGFYLWPLVIAFIPTAWIAAKSKHLRLLVITGLTLLCGLLLESWIGLPHYAAPVTAIVIALLVLSLRLMRTIRWKGLGLAFSRATLTALVGLFLFLSFYTAANPWGFTSDFPLSYAIEHARLGAELARLPGQHLVILRTGDDDNPGWDAPYNDPDLEHAKVIWAHDMGEAKNAELIRYFHERRAWMIDQHDAFIRLKPYQPAEAQYMARGSAEAQSTAHGK